MFSWKNVKTILFILIGNVILAFALSAFILPHGMIVGGTTGLSIIINHYFHVELSIVVAVLNVILFFCGLFFLGKKFALTTILSTVIFPGLLSFFSSMEWLQNLTDNLLMAALYGGVLIGIGIGMVLRAGASTGGLDIPPLILNKKFGIPVGLSMYAIDFTILLVQVLFSNTEQVLYGIIITLLDSVVVNQVMVSGNQKFQIFVISQKTEKLREKLVFEMDFGVSLVHMEAGYTGKEQMGLLCVTTQRNLPVVKDAVREIDPKAFITVSRIYEVEGRGFTLERK